MKRIKYRGFFIDKADTGYRVSKQSDSSIHSHICHLNPCYVLIDSVMNKRIPAQCSLYYLKSHTRIADDGEYKRRL